MNQEAAKQDVLNKLDERSCLIVMDWAMKFLPQRFRERMSDFFGKRGKSWHVSAVITKPKGGRLEVDCLVHIFNACTQDSFAVLSIIDLSRDSQSSIRSRARKRGQGTKTNKMAGSGDF